MTDKTNLRKQAEAKLALSPESLAPLSPEAIQQTIHELRVHQIELEMQNEELRKAQSEIEAGRARYFDLYDMAPVGYVSIGEKGLILEANLTAATLLGVPRSTLLKQPFSRFVLKEDTDTYYLSRKKLVADTSTGTLLRQGSGGRAGLAGGSHVWAMRLVNRAGTVIWAHFTGRSAQEEDGETVCRLAFSDITQSKLTQEKLRLSETALRDAQHLAHIGSWRLNVQTDQVVWSEELYRILGFDPALEPPPRTEYMKLFTPESWARLSAAQARTRVIGIPYQLELEVAPENGRGGWIWVRGEAVKDETGRIIELLGIAQDITERKRMEEAIRASERKFRTLVEASYSGIWKTDAEGRNTYVSPRWCELAGMSEADAAGRGWASGLHPDDRIPVQTGWEVAATAARPYSAEFRFVHPDGLLVWVLCQASPLMVEGRVVEWIGTITDITARKDAEESLRESESRFRSLFENHAAVQLIVDPLTGAILDVNPAAVDYYGWSRETMRHMRIQDINTLSPQDVKLEMQLAQEKRRNYFEFKHRRADGSIRDVAVFSSNVASAGKPILHSIIHDITDRKIMEEEVHAYRNQLELRVAERTRQLEQEIDEHRKSVQALAISEAYNNALFAAIPDPIFILSRDGRFVDCKVHSEIQLLMPREQFIGRRIQDVLPPSVATQLQENLTDVFEGMSRHFDYQLVVGGETLFYEASLIQMDTDRALALVHNNTEGKRRELLIQQQSSLITSLLDSIPDIISFKDTNGVYLGCNPPFEAFVGRSRDQIVGRTDYDLFSQEVADAFRANDAKMLEGDESRHNDEWITYPDGRSILIDTLKTPYRGAAGERIGILGISRDITERYRAEAQVKAQERLYRGLVESQSDLIVRVDMKHRFTFVNDAYCQTFGKTREELIGQEFAPLVHPDDLAATMESLKGLEYPPYRVKVEQRAMTRTGWRWIAWEDSGILNDEGGVIEIQAVGRDITDFRQAMMALERLSGIQDSLMHLATGLINIPVAGQDAAINQALGDIGKQIAADRAYLMSYDFETGLIRNTHEWCDAGIEPQIANLQFVPMADVPEWVAAHKAGRTIEVECVSALSPEDPLRHILEPRGIQSLITLPLTGEGQCLGFIGFDAVRNQRAWTGEERDLLRILAEIFANFATRNKLDQRLIMARDQADSASKAKSEFLANMSHELRTPLNAVIGFSEALTDRYFGGLTDKQSQYVRYISDAGRHLLALINDILDLSKIEAGRMELELSPISVRDVLEGSLVMIKERCFVHRLALALTIAPELNERVIEADARKVKQIMFNLLSNAAKFTPDGGSITVNARLIEDDHGPRVEVSVADTGIGIPGELQQKVFEPFHQLLGRRRDKTPGTGLGLSVSRKLINLHGGEISLESGGVDKGTRVSFWLPGARAPLQKVSDWGTGCAGSDSIPREGAAP